MTSEEKALRYGAYLSEDTRGVYADWLEERGDPRAKFWRYTHVRGLRPEEMLEELLNFDNDVFEWVEFWGWSFPDQGCPIRIDKRAQLPTPIWKKMGCAAYQKGRYWKRYKTLASAWKAAEKAWLWIHTHSPKEKAKP